MHGQTIQHKDEVKHLGVTLDSKLTWRSRINKKIATAKGNMVRLLTEMRGTFNTKPKLVKWAYTGVIRPKLTYASIAWCNGLIYDYQSKELSKLDRLACRVMATHTRTTSQAALNIMFDLTPLHLHIQELAISAYNRLEAVIGMPWEPVSKTKKAPHLWYLNQLLNNYCLNLPATDACQENIWTEILLLILTAWYS